MKNHNVVLKMLTPLAVFQLPLQHIIHFKSLMYAKLCLVSKLASSNFLFSFPPNYLILQDIEAVTS